MAKPSEDNEGRGAELNVVNTGGSQSACWRVLREG